jgi:S-DNA-T family DNA segregation ATPase FtsK/SpoIIIE
MMIKDRALDFLEGTLPLKPRNRHNVFKDPVFGAAARILMEDNFHYRWRPHDATETSPPLANWIFGAYRDDPNDLTNHLMDATDALVSTPPSIFFLIGRDKKTGEPVWGDLEEVISFLVSGVRGTGKTNALHVMMLSMMWGMHPSAMLLDVFSAKHDFHRYKQLIGVHENMDTFVEVAKKLEEEMYERQEVLKLAGFSKITEYNEFRFETEKPLMPFRVVVVDEFAAITALHPDFGATINTLSSVGRAAGFFFIFATQRADADQFPSSVKAQATDRASFAQADRINESISGVEGSSTLKDAGEAMVNIGRFTHRVQTPLITQERLRFILKGLKEEGKVFKSPN